MYYVVVHDGVFVFLYILTVQYSCIFNLYFSVGIIYFFTQCALIT